MVFVGILLVEEHGESYPYVVGIYEDKLLAIEEVEKYRRHFIHDLEIRFNGDGDGNSSYSFDDLLSDHYNLELFTHELTDIEIRHKY